MSHYTFTVESNAETGFFDISDQVASMLRRDGMKNGICTVFVTHTTAAVTVNESADPAVKHDIISALEKIVPLQDGYTHTEGNSAAHIKASLLGCSVSIPVSNGRLALGTWQGVFFCEFDGPRRRSVCCTFTGS